MHMPSEIRNKCSPPSSKGRQDFLKNGRISLLPYVPTGQNHNFKEEGFIKILPCSKDNLLNG
jgi:hypothetical protein